MTVGSTVTLLGLGAVASGLVIWILVLTMMIEEINREREAGDEMRFSGFSLSETTFVYREYRRQVPRGRLHVAACGLFALSIMGLLALAVVLRFAH